MAIHIPGRRDRHNRALNNTKKNVVATLTLTAMVDMFTVLVVFLLQNYKTTDTVLYIPQTVQLPKASSTKELKPAHVITISPQEVTLDNQPIVSFMEVKEQKDWMIKSLFARVSEALMQDDVDYKQGLRNQLRTVVAGAKNSQAVPEESRRKVTVQADKSIDFLTIKKVMYTATEAGVIEINFAVINEAKPKIE